MARAEAAYEGSDASDFLMAAFTGDHGLVLSNQLEDKNPAIEKYQESIRMFRGFPLILKVSRPSHGLHYFV